MEEIKPIQSSQLASSASETPSELPNANHNRKPKIARPLAIGSWEDPSLQRWMGSIIRGSTRSVYRSGFRLYVDYTQLTASQLIDEALEDVKRDQREKRDIVKQRLIGFYSWLIEKAPKKGPGGSETGKLGLSSKICHTYVGAIRSFYSTYEIFIKLSRRSKLPEPKVENPRMILNNLQVKKLLDNTRSMRDKAVILTMFQGGMDVSTLCSLKQKDFKEAEEVPLKLELQRPKTGVDYYTFIGRDAVEAIKVYISDAKSRGIQLAANDPLFLKESSKAFSKEGILPNLVQKVLRDVAIRSGLISEEALAGKDFNPIGPHALRESFGSIMSSHGVADSIVDFWLGHKSKGTDEAYKKHDVEELRKLYLEKEPFFSIGNGSELEKKLKREIEEKNQQLQLVINSLSSENYTLKDKVAELAGKVDTLAELFLDSKQLFDSLAKEGMVVPSGQKWTEEDKQRIFKRQQESVKNLKL